MSSPGDPTKQRLQERKDFCCGVADRLRGRDAPLADEGERIWLANTVMAAAELGDRLLTDQASPLYLPASRWVFWTAPNPGPSLSDHADGCCAEACAALEAYCDLLGQTRTQLADGLLVDAARAVWNGQQCFGRLLALAGVRAPDG